MSIPFSLIPPKPQKAGEHAKNPSFTKKGPGRYHKQGGAK